MRHAGAAGDRFKLVYGGGPNDYAVLTVERRASRWNVACCYRSLVVATMTKTLCPRTSWPECAVRVTPGTRHSAGRSRQVGLSLAKCKWRAMGLAAESSTMRMGEPVVEPERHTGL